MNGLVGFGLKSWGVLPLNSSMVPCLFEFFRNIFFCLPWVRSSSSTLVRELVSDVYFGHIFDIYGLLLSY